MEETPSVCLLQYQLFKVPITFFCNEIKWPIAYHPIYSSVPNKWAGPNKWVGWADFLVYYMKNSGEGGQILRLLNEKQRAGWTNFQKSLINGHARLLGTQECLDASWVKGPFLCLSNIANCLWGSCTFNGYFFTCNGWQWGQLFYEFEFNFLYGWISKLSKMLTKLGLIVLKIKWHKFFSEGFSWNWSVYINQFKF